MTYARICEVRPRKDKRDFRSDLRCAAIRSVVVRPSRPAACDDVLPVEETEPASLAVSIGECNSNSNEGSPRISRFPVFYRDVRSDRDANRGRFFLGKNVNASVNGERPFLRIIE